MTTPTQLAKQIRFTLATLAETNDHHAFERICLGLARRRIASNLLPATGPVAAGGDQGRDAESHWTGLPAEGVSSWFTALASTDGVVLACTLQRADVAGKIRRDVVGITTSGSEVGRVVYFVVEPVPVARRHELQAWARETYDVALDIWDAQAISQVLAEHDLFHLAVDHLHLPSELAPLRPVDAPDLPDWYVEDLADWRGRPHFVGSMGEVVALREPLRYSSTHAHAHADLADWLSIARALRQAVQGGEAGRRLDYEIVLATAFGQNSVRPADSMLADYFRDLFSSALEPAGLTDPITLLRLVSAMLFRGETSLSRDLVVSWFDQLGAAIDLLVSSAPGPNARAQALRAQALLAHSPTVPDDVADPDRMPTMTQIASWLRENGQGGPPRISPSSDRVLVDLDTGMAALTALVEILPQTPLVPLEDLATNFDMHAPLLRRHPHYALVRDALDDATERIHGHAARGDRARARAVALLEAEEPRSALREIHEAKVHWLTGETAEGAAQMMLLASRVYYELRLPMAAKQYALAAAGIALRADDVAFAGLVPEGLMVAATCDHLAGQWLTASSTFRAGILAQAQFADDPWDTNRHRYFANMLVDQAHIVRAARSLRPGALPILRPVIESTHLDTMLDPMLSRVESIPAMSEEEMAQAAVRDRIGQPFSDAGQRRVYEWQALNNTWRVSVANKRAAVLAAERFIAATQVFLADEESVRELLILPGTISVTVEVADDDPGPERHFEDHTDDTAGSFGVWLTSVDRLTPDQAELETCLAVLRILATLSLLPQEPFMEIVEAEFARGLWHKLNAIRPYDELADLHDAAVYQAMADAPFSAISTGSAPEADGADLVQADRWTSVKYDSEQSRRAIEATYEKLHAPVRFTLVRLRDDEQFRAVVSELRQMGWLDWHLLTAVANTAGNHRARVAGLPMTTRMTRADRQRFTAVMLAEENETDPDIPATLFTVDSLRFHLGPAAAASLGWRGLRLNTGSVSPDDVLRVLGARFRYWTDDVPHEGIFD